MKSTLILAVTGLAFLPNILAASAPSCYGSGKAVLTNYWVTKEGTEDMDNDGNTVYLTGPKTVALKDTSGNTIEMVAQTTFDKCNMEGTCLLLSSKMVNLVSNKKFESIDRKSAPYGLGSNDKVLVPFVSIASNDLPKGSTVYMTELDGMKLPNGKTHNGCVRVDDESWSFNGL
ncbi:hypothetical protein BC936DRAFT_139089 [Jimgerdemannia flammicorona]|uniref:Uncharacterized protein n=1 Tax=Jimgerdemannia flammicorona TaxID=994334 RepID=A0A433DHU6_9FUNG|nr:hypothetical protein BC936DRAFT_139089 [Jimgerdemannia flammicorona]